jgi:hypothetical protein
MPALQVQNPFKQDQRAVIQLLDADGCQLLEIHDRMRAENENACATFVVE